MTLPLIIILAAYLLLQGGGYFFTVLNLKHLAQHGTAIPAGFESYIDRQVLRRMRDYALAKGRYNLLSSVVEVAVTIVFMFGGLLVRYNAWIAGQNWPPVIAAIIFFWLLLLAETVLRIPFDLFNTFQLERKYNFNTRTFGLWVTDLLKALALSVLLAGLLLAAIFGLMQASPLYWWLIGWVFLLLFSIFMLYISPYVIEPLFNKYTPLADAELARQIMAVMAKAGLSVTRVFAVDASKRSRHSNAYFTGIGRVKRIVLFDTLLKNHTSQEILAVLAHEAGHCQKRHVQKRLLVTQVLMLAGLYLAYRFMQSDWLALLFGVAPPTPYAKFLLVGFIGSLVVAVVSPLGSWLARRQEWAADRFAVALTKDPQALATALVKMSRDNLANLHPHPWYAALYYSHPPLAERVRQLRLPPGVSSLSVHRASVNH